MISNTFQTNTFVEGMDCDTDITMLPNQRYRYAENIRVITNDEGTTGVLQGIEGVKKYIASIASDETIIGTTTVNKYAIVITVKNDGYNKVYRIDNFDQNTLSLVVVLKGNIGLCSDLDETPNISIVANYESDSVIKIYFTDGKSSVKMFNIMDTRYSDSDSELIDSNGDIINPLALDITPGCILPPFKMQNLGIGSLPSGMVQYCYQLFNLYSSETTTSPLSEIIHLTASSTNQDSQTYEGSYPDTSSNKSVTVSTDLITKDFERCRIIRILYTSNNTIPTITIVDEIEVLPTQDILSYTDTGNSYMADITVDEFNSLTGYQFIGCSLTKLQNRLFVSDITEDTWDPGFYDARSYRCNASGEVLLQSANNTNNLSFNIDSYDLSSIPQEHDCINPYNSLEYSTCSPSDLYVYGVSNGTSRKLGGRGINIDYTFITTDILIAEDSLNSDTLLSNECSMNVAPRVVNSLDRSEIDSDDMESVILQDSNTAIRIPNYADPYIAANFKGYQRDEIYRFGIIFYNNKSLPSPVYWIGDIKMPHTSQSHPFVFKQGKLIGKALGVRFTVRNVPDGAISYEIVRCDRTENDRHVVMQVVASNLYEYKILENEDLVGRGDELDSSIEMRPTPFFTNIRSNMSTTKLSYDLDPGDFNTNEDTEIIYGQDRIDDYIRVVSPEICVQKSDIEKYLKDSAYMDIVGSLFSPTETSGDNRWSIFSVAQHTTDNQDNTIDWSSRPTYARLKNDIFDIRFPNIYNKYEKDDSLGFEGLVSKYFYPFYSLIQSTGANISILNAVYAEPIPYNAVHDVSPYRFNIGERTYTNWAVTQFRKAKSNTIFGPAGPALILYAQNYTNSFQGESGEGTGLSTAYSFNAVYVLNIKRNTTSAYGGTTYSSRQNSVYISTNSYVKVTTAASVTTNTYGGDTFLGLLDYPNMFIFQANNASDYKWSKAFMASYIPFETSINTNLFNGDMVHRSYTSNNYIDVHLQAEPQQTQTYHAQDRPYYVYNSVYSSQMGAKQFVPKSIYAQSNVHTNNRILVSQAKTNNEITDNWSIFRVSDYLDVDNQYGGITNLKTFKDKLFYFQDSAVGIASVNERSLITDGNANQLVLGTGGILSRYDYITTLNGSSIINDRSIMNSDNVLYWYDYDKNEICAYNGQVNILSKEKNVQSYLNEMYDQKRNVNLAFYDKKYNEAWFKFYNKSLIFNEQIGRFTSFYTFNPDWALLFSNKIVTIKDNNFYVINTLDIDGLGNVDKTAKLQIVVNKDVMYTKTFDNINISGEMLDKNNANLTKDLIDKIVFGTKHQTATSTNPVFDYRENTYRLPIPRQDTNNEDTSLSYPARMRGKTMICDYQFNTNDEKTFKIPYITTTYRYSLI